MNTLWVSWGAVAWVWICYIIGQCVGILIHSDQDVMNKFTPWKTLWNYLVAHQNSVLYKFAIETALFWIWWHTPQDLGMFGLEKAKLLPLNPATAVIYGAFSDRIVGYVMAKFGCAEPKKDEEK